MQITPAHTPTTLTDGARKAISLYVRDLAVTLMHPSATPLIMSRSSVTTTTADSSAPPKAKAKGAVVHILPVRTSRSPYPRAEGRGDGIDILKAIPPVIIDRDALARAWDMYAHSTPLTLEDIFPRTTTITGLRRNLAVVPFCRAALAAQLGRPLLPGARAVGICGLFNCMNPEHSIEASESIRMSIWHARDHFRRVGVPDPFLPAILPDLAASLLGVPAPEFAAMFRPGRDLVHASVLVLCAANPGVTYPPITDTAVFSQRLAEHAETGKDEALSYLRLVLDPNVRPQLTSS